MSSGTRHLIIDTASEALSVALFEDGTLIGHHHEIAGRGHAEKLIPAIATLPDGGRAQYIWVDAGPGSFTGIRVGLAAARALAFAWGADLKSFSSLTLLAAQARHDGETDDVIPIAITGGHGELFWQQFDRESLAPLAPPASVPIAELAAMADAPSIYGTGAQALVSARGSGEARLLYPDARAALLLPNAALSEGATASYGRGADAALPATAMGGA
tara:strand:- start:105 stop:752 length:648 start_codon:yes stop_codon:yes gene_type:complete